MRLWMYSISRPPRPRQSPGQRSRVDSLPDAVCLIPAPVSTDFEDPELTRSRRTRSATLAPKLGVLMLAGVLEHAGTGVSLFDVDGAYTDFLRGDDRWGVEKFPDWV